MKFSQNCLLQSVVTKGQVMSTDHALCLTPGSCLQLSQSVGIDGLRQDTGGAADSDLLPLPLFASSEEQFAGYLAKKLSLFKLCQQEFSSHITLSAPVC